MTELTNRQRYEFLLIDNNWDALKKISADNADIIVDMLAGAICYAEKSLKIECPEESQVDLLMIVVEELKTPSKGLSIAPFLLHPPIHELATVAISRYRECAIQALGGNQTPCTLQVFNDTEKSRETQHVYRVPLISRWISNVRRTLRKIAILLGISKFSEEDFL
ncbi:hypothetical protein ACF8QD_02505 [Aeromonas media]|uniref:hypothetical protein n=1 Tax=Aeromonas media TaxID=651 RepID=UPI00370CE5D9